MKRTIWAWVVAAAVGFGIAWGTASADTPGRFRTTSYSVLPYAAYTQPTDAGHGATLVDTTAYRVSACVPAGDFLDAGTLLGWVYDSDQSTWTRRSGLDLTVTAAGTRCQSWPEASVLVSSGRVYYSPHWVGHYYDYDPLDGGAVERIVREDGGRVTIQIKTWLGK